MSRYALTIRSARLFLLFALAILAIHCTRATATEAIREAAALSQDEFSAAFDTTQSHTNWIVKAGAGQDERRASPSRDRATAWDLSRVHRLSVRATTVKRSNAAVRLRWVIESRVGGLYSMATPTPIGMGAVSVAVDLDPETSELIPDGHSRPWDALAAAEVLHLGLRAECYGAANPTETAELVLESPLVESSTSVGGETAALTDVRAETPPGGYNAAATLIFRIDPEPADPFASTGAGDVRVKTSAGQQALAYYDQDFIAMGDGAAQRRVPIGRPYWRAHLQTWPQNGELIVSSGSRNWTLKTAAITIGAGEHTAPMTDLVDTDCSSGPSAPCITGPRAERWRAPLTQNRVEADAWGCAPKAFALTSGGAWKPDANGASAFTGTVWRPVLFWSSQWGAYGGPRRPDVSIARDMDGELTRAAEKGIRHPLVILDGEAFEREGVFNWDTHPLRGELQAPGELFNHEEGLDYCLRSMRYAIARWSLSKAVSELVITARLSHPAAPLFHAKLASSLALWPVPRGMSIRTANPLACEPTLITTLGSFKPDAPQALGPWTSERHAALSDASLVGGDTPSMQVQAREASSIALTLLNTFHVTGPMMGREPDNLSKADSLLFNVWIPADAAPDLRVGVHLRDKDGIWYQALLPGLIRPGDWSTYALDITGRNLQKLRAVHSMKLWTDYSRQRVSEVGLHVYSVHPNWHLPNRQTLPLSARFDNIRAVSFAKPPAAPPTIVRVEPMSDGAKPLQGPSGGMTLGRGELWECHVKISKTFENPFDPCQCDLRAVVKTPSGHVVPVPAFLDQLCERRANKNGDESVDPLGEEFFTVRYRAQEAGPHSVVLQLREGGKYNVDERWEHDPRFTSDGVALRPLPGGHWTQTRYEGELQGNGRRRVDKVNFEAGPVTAELKLDSPTFTVSDAKNDFHGFIHPATDQRHFQYDDGSFYYPIGPCLRSPSDTRLPYLDAKWNVDNIARIGRRGTYQYDDYLTKFGEAGINWARVWMCSWWCALEWRRDWHGYQGFGRYNLLNAWRLDYILKKCEENGVRVDLGLINHGQFTQDIDTEWNNNPYNAALGGPLTAASEFFTDKAAKIAHQNRLRYVVARYAHSPSIFAWSLCSEMEFTEEYERHVKWGQRDMPAPNIENWVEEMADFLKATDPYHHMVTTHFSHPERGENTLMQPGVDFATSNAYSAFDEIQRPDGAFDASYALAAFWGGNDHLEGFHIFKKPALVEEQGRHWIGVETRGGRMQENNTREQLDADLHAGLWGSMVQPLAGATGYWWWLHVHFDNRYDEYRALANFMKGEDMRPMKGESALEPVSRENIEASGGQFLCGRALKSDLRMYAWIYHARTPLGGPVEEISGGAMHITKLKPGDYTIEYWDTYKGAISSTATLNVTDENQRVELKLPNVNRDIAIKLKRR